jgi:hypothetical protein
MSDERAVDGIASYFEECSRLLRAHGDLFGPEALRVVAVVAALSLKVAREAAKQVAPGAILTGVADQALIGAFRATGDRASAALLGRVRRAWLAGVARAERPSLRVSARVEEDGALSYFSSCPRCDALERRNVAAPAPCACGFQFEPMEHSE